MGVWASEDGHEFTMLCASQLGLQGVGRGSLAGADQSLQLCLCVHRARRGQHMSCGRGKAARGAANGGGGRRARKAQIQDVEQVGSNNSHFQEGRRTGRGGA